METFFSIWYVVDVVSDLNWHVEQEQIMAGFYAVSTVRFQACVGAIDGVLISINKPSENDADVSGLGRRKYFCRQKKKFGLNFQAVSDIWG